MSRGTELKSLVGYFCILIFGCGQSIPTAVNARAGDPPATPKEELRAKKARLADLEKAVGIKEKELATLQDEAEVLRKAIAAAESPQDKVFRTGKELLADMPTDVYPKFGPTFRPERATSQKWCQKSLLGREVEWTATVDKIEIIGDGPFTVCLDLKNQMLGSGGVFSSVALGGPFTLGEQRCQVGLRGKGDPEKGVSGIFLLGVTKVSYSHCTAAESGVLRKLESKKVAFRAQVAEVTVFDSQWRQPVIGKESDEWERFDWVPFDVVVSVPSINGFLPEADRPKSKKK